MPDLRIVCKKLARELSLRRRHSRLTVKDLVEIEKLQKVLLVIAFQIGRCNSEQEKEKVHWQGLLRLGYVGYLLLSHHEINLNLPPVPRRARTIDSFNESDCYTLLSMIFMS